MKRQRRKIDEAAARGHGGTSGPNGEIGPSIFCAKPAPRSISLLAVSAGISRCNLRRRSDTER